MKTPEEIKRGLALCKVDECFGEREDCPYAGDPALCVGKMCDDVLAYIQQLEQDNAQKDERIRKLEREKEALLNIVSRLCIYCKNRGVPKTNEPCYSCVRMGRNNWEWRGVKEEANEAERSN